MNRRTESDTMTPELYKLAGELFAQACELPADERTAFVEAKCGADSMLREQVQSMLNADAIDGLEPGGAMPRDLDATLDSASPFETPAPSSPVARKVAGYELMEEIGRGGMGVVYKARQLQPKRIVAVKMIRSGQFASYSDIQRFYTEAESAANVDDDGIVPVYEVGQCEGEPFFSMKFVDGVSLAERLKAGDLPLDESLAIMLAVTRAVASVHAQDIVHRDLKPSNILIDREGRPRVTDFGLAKCLHGDSSLTAAGDIMGTPGYMSPEQAFGTAQNVTPAADVYSLGAMLYEMLTGQPPIQSADGNVADTLQRIRDHEVQSARTLNRRIPKDLNTICMKCLELDPAKRYPSARELAEDLQRYLQGEPILARPQSLRRRVLRWARRSPGLAATWIGVAVFYIYHLICHYILQFPELNTAFHITSTVVAAAWAVGAWIFQRQMDRTKGASVYLFGWATLDVALLTSLVYVAGGVRSALVSLYFVLVAGSVLRDRARLVGYVTFLSLAGYLVHVASSFAYGNGPPALTVFPFVICLLVIGLIQFLALRHLRAERASSR